MLSAYTPRSGGLTLLDKVRNKFQKPVPKKMPAPVGGKNSKTQTVRAEPVAPCEDDNLVVDLSQLENDDDDDEI